MTSASRQIATPDRSAVLAFQDPRSTAVLTRIREIAPHNTHVLIVGERGAGKSLLARHLHELSPRADAPFVAVHCAAFSEVQADSELLGHEKGAFIGAFEAKAGWLEAADGGTLFLDDVTRLPLATQSKLLTALAEQHVVRLGSSRRHPIDVRVVVACVLAPQAAIEAGLLSAPLFAFLNPAEVLLPPLRDRHGDIGPLARHIVRTYHQRLGYGAVQLDAAAERKLSDHAWPGNIPELENVLHQGLLACRGPVLGASDLPPLASRPAPGEPLHGGGQQALEAALHRMFSEAGPALFDRIEETVMRAAFAHCQRNQVQAAQLLGISRNVLRARLIKNGEIAALK